MWHFDFLPGTPPPFCWDHINSLRSRLNWRPFTDDIFKSIVLNENEWISTRISLKFVLKVLINNIPALVQIIAWRRSGGKPLSEPMMVSLLMHICVTRPQWVKEPIWAVVITGDKQNNFDIIYISQILDFPWSYSMRSLLHCGNIMPLTHTVISRSYLLSNWNEDERQKYKHIES